MKTIFCINNILCGILETQPVESIVLQLVQNEKENTPVIAAKCNKDITGVSHFILDVKEGLSTRD